MLIKMFGVGSFHSTMLCKMKISKWLVGGKNLISTGFGEVIGGSFFFFFSQNRRSRDLNGWLLPTFLQIRV
jgi:hypothetical protein